MKKSVRFLSVVFFSLFLTSSVSSSFAQAPPQRYADKYRTMAGKLAKEFGIPRVIIMAVAIIESSSGQARNVRDLNNHFGIVGKNTVARRTRYKQYSSEEESYRDFCRVISRKSFYSSLRGTTDPKKWAKAISEAGYSEKPTLWKQNVMNIVNTHRL